MSYTHLIFLAISYFLEDCSLYMKKALTHSSVGCESLCFQCKVEVERDPICTSSSDFRYWKTAPIISGKSLLFAHLGKGPGTSHYV